MRKLTNAGQCGLQFGTEADDLNFVTFVANATLAASTDDSTTTRDGEHVYKDDLQLAV